MKTYLLSPIPVDKMTQQQAIYTSLLAAFTGSTLPDPVKMRKRCAEGTRVAINAEMEAGRQIELI